MARIASGWNAFTRSGQLDIALHLLLLAALTAYYVFQCTVGTFRTLAWNTDYYNMAAEGFRRGQLHLPQLPSSLLLAQPNPYDPINRGLWLWDTVLWNGRYYIYWGPVPALFLVVVKALGLHDGKIFDQWLVLIFMLGRLYAGSALIWSIASRANRRLPTWTSLLTICAFALVSPTPFMMARPVIYEACIAAGQCFLYLGLLAAFWALEKHKLALAVLAGFCWGLALNSRVTWVVVAPMFVGVCAVAAYQRASIEKGRAFVRAACAFGLPLLLSLAGTAAYNYARFGSATDFGVAHQLTGRTFIPDTRFALPNLYSYLFAELDWSCVFPFVQVSTHRLLPGYITWPLDYDVGAWPLGERVSGVFVTTPLLWMIGALALPPLHYLWQRYRGQMPDHRRISPYSTPQACMLICSLCCMLSLIPALTNWTASMRYLEDPIGGAVIVAYLACFPLLRSGQTFAQRVLSWSGRVLYAGLAVYSIAVGLGLGFSGMANNFARENPRLYMELVNDYSVCPKAQ